jgi:DnaJ-class molecular chaperone
MRSMTRKEEIRQLAKVRRRVKGARRRNINYFTLGPITLKEGEVLCDKCRGEGIVLRVTKNTIRDNESVACKKCLGHGKLDWIENVTGSTRENPYSRWSIK